MLFTEHANNEREFQMRFKIVSLSHISVNLAVRLNFSSDGNDLRLASGYRTTAAHRTFSNEAATPTTACLISAWLQCFNRLRVVTTSLFCRRGKHDPLGPANIRRCAENARKVISSPMIDTVLKGTSSQALLGTWSKEGTITR